MYVFPEGTKASLTQNGEVIFQYLKTFAETHYSSLSFVVSQFIFLSSLAPICCLKIGFK